MIYDPDSGHRSFWVVNCQSNGVHDFSVSTFNFNDEKNELGEVEELCLNFILTMFLMSRQ